MGKHILDISIDDIIKRYTVKLEPMIDIANTYHCSRQAIFYALKRAGIDTSKEKRGSMRVTCAFCGRLHKKTRANIRSNRHHFCDQGCYWAWLELGRKKTTNKYIEYAHGRTEARKLVSKYIELLPGYIVHHEDRNQRNNDIINLKVFASQGDHTRYHRGFRVPIIWDGSKITKSKRTRTK
jgi:hypothetical protein